MSTAERKYVSLEMLETSRIETMKELGTVTDLEWQLHIEWMECLDYLGAQSPVKKIREQVLRRICAIHKNLGMLKKSREDTIKKIELLQELEKRYPRRTHCFNLSTCGCKVSL